MRQHESEAAALGRQLQTKMSEMEQHNGVQEEMQHLLQQANRDIVRANLACTCVFTARFLASVFSSAACALSSGGE